LKTAARLAARLRPLHTALERKLYFDDLYGLVLVGGTHLLKGLCCLFDNLIVDGVVNLLGRVTRRLSRFSGDVLDVRGVDGAVNAVGEGTWRLGGLARAPQVGRIRNYILFALSGAMVLLVLLANSWRS